MEKGLVSVVICTYRNFSEVYGTLENVFGQDYPRIEVVISDDGSPEWEAEASALQAWAEKHRGENIERLLFDHMPENRGTVQNCNNGYGLAQGEYLKDISPGDLLANPHALSRYVELLEGSGTLIGFSRMVGVTPEGREIAHLASSAEDYDVMNRMSPEALRNRLFSRNCLPAPAWFAKKELFETCGYYDPEVSRLMEDYPYWIRLCTEGVRIAFWDEVLVHYRLDHSGAGNYGKNFMKDLKSIYDRCIFPADRRFGILQPCYNALKRGGLAAYTDRACWDEYTAGQKAGAWLKHGLFFLYINLGDARMRRKNRAAVDETRES